MSLPRLARGMSLVDVLVGTALVVIIFVALFGLLRASLLVSSAAKSKAMATAVANSHMEYIRSLEYDAIGTLGGIPAGGIEEATTTVMNGITFDVRTFVQYVDDPADGLGIDDETNIVTDYKRVKVTVTYAISGNARTVELVSNQAPAGLETTTGGGTLQINVVNATGGPVAGATVEITNPSLSPTIDLTAYTNAAGSVYLPGAATSTDYRVAVTKSGYSNAQTYTRDATNQNPTPGYLTVAANQTTAGTFAIDQLATLEIRTYTPPTVFFWSDMFADSTKLVTLTNTVTVGGALTLASSAGVYVSSGSAVSETSAPSALSSWIEASSTVSVPTGTNIAVHVMYSGALVPDSALPGNSVGFTTFPIDLSTLSTTTFPSLSLTADMATTDTNVAPEILEWSIGAQSGSVPVPNVSLTLAGAKTIGSTGAGAPIYKTAIATTTNASGARTLSIEWDVYQMAVAAYDVIDACTSSPYSLSPNTSTQASLTLSTDTTHSALVTVRDSGGAIVPGASVTLYRSGYSSTATTGVCGTAYFGGVSATSYSIDIAKSGQTSITFTNVVVSGDTFYAAAFE